mgnify:CR=1 FL=1
MLALRSSPLLFSLLLTTPGFEPHGGQILLDYALSHDWGCSVDGEWAMIKALPETVHAHACVHRMHMHMHAHGYACKHQWVIRMALPDTVRPPADPQTGIYTYMHTYSTGATACRSTDAARVVLSAGGATLSDFPTVRWG